MSYLIAKASRLHSKLGQPRTTQYQIINPFNICTNNFIKNERIIFRNTEVYTYIYRHITTTNEKRQEFKRKPGRVNGKIQMEEMQRRNGKWLIT